MDRTSFLVAALMALHSRFDGPRAAAPGVLCPVAGNPALHSRFIDDWSHAAVAVAVCSALHSRFTNEQQCGRRVAGLLALHSHFDGMTTEEDGLPYAVAAFTALHSHFDGNHVDARGAVPPVAAFSALHSHFDPPMFWPLGLDEELQYSRLCTAILT